VLELFNNVGPALPGPGGGGGELKKHELLKDYKFALTFENSSGSGYCTESSPRKGYLDVFHLLGRPEGQS
jgi:hypothetical protein